MRSRVVRVTLTLLAVAALGTAAYYYRTGVSRINASLQSSGSFIQARAEAIRAAYDLRSAQQAYVAAGQNEAFWFERVTASLDALRQAIAVLERETTSGEARAALADVKAATDDLEARDRRLRGYASSGQKLLASDIIFSDALQIVARITSGLDSASDHARKETATFQASAAREQTLVLAAGGGAAVLFLLLLGMTGSSRPVRAEPQPLDHAQPAGLLNLELRPAPIASPEDSTSAATSTARKLTSRGKPPSPVAATASQNTVATRASQHTPIKLEDLAGVCADLARLSDTSAIPEILQRTALALDARGLVLWAADAERRQLMPIAAHGYEASVLSRMSGVPADSPNATASAFRTGLLQTVRGNGSTNGAIAAPLVSPAGPLGVLSLEMRKGGEDRPERLAAATIVASQLATIVGPAAESADRSIG